MLLIPTIIRVRRCVNCFRHIFVVQKLYINLHCYLICILLKYITKKIILYNDNIAKLKIWGKG